MTKMVISNHGSETDPWNCLHPCMKSLFPVARLPAEDIFYKSLPGSKFVLILVPMVLFPVENLVSGKDTKYFT